MHPSLKPLTVARKAFVAACLIIANGLQADVFPHPWDDVLIAVLAVAGYFGVYATRNAPVVNSTEDQR
jgi:hypothetical protein